MLIDCHNHLGVDLFFYLNGYHPYAQDLPAMVTEGRHCGVDHWVVFPMVANLTFNVAAMRSAQLIGGGCESVPYAFENRRMLREISALSGSGREDASVCHPRSAAGSRRAGARAARTLREVPVLRPEDPGDDDSVQRRSLAQGGT